MSKFGFTGTQVGMTKHQKVVFQNTLFSLATKGDEFHHGDCIGADEDAHKIAILIGLHIHIHPPSMFHKRANCQANVKYSPRPYLKRNHDIVDSTDLLIATPKSKREELRSGTWATIRYAQKKHKQVIIIYPE